MTDSYTKAGKRILRNWGTPDWLFEKLHHRFAFTLDAAADADNHKLDKYWTAEDDALTKSWDDERVFCNPPYGPGLEQWVEKGRSSRNLAVLLVPSRTEMTWWCKHAPHAHEIIFIEGRVHFFLPDNPKGSRPVFASAILVFQENSWHRVERTPIVLTLRTPWMEKHRPL